VNRRVDFVDFAHMDGDSRRMLSRSALKAKKSSTSGIGFSRGFDG
jgi:hypothetical protein